MSARSRKYFDNDEEEDKDGQRYGQGQDEEQTRSYNTMKERNQDSRSSRTSNHQNNQHDNYHKNNNNNHDNLYDSEESVDHVRVKEPTRRSPRNSYRNVNNPNNSNNATTNDSNILKPKWSDSDSIDNVVRTKFVPKSIVSTEIMNPGRGVSASADSWATGSNRGYHPRSRLDESDLLPSNNGKENYPRGRRSESDWNNARPKQMPSGRYEPRDNYNQSNRNRDGGSSGDGGSNNNSSNQNYSNNNSNSNNTVSRHSYHRSRDNSIRRSDERLDLTLSDVRSNTKPDYENNNQDDVDLYSFYPQTTSQRTSRRSSTATNIHNDHDTEDSYHHSNYNNHNSYNNTDKKHNSNNNNNNVSNDTNTSISSEKSDFLTYDNLSSSDKYVIDNLRGPSKTLVNRGPRVFNGKYSFVQIAHPNDVKTEHVQCLIVRSRGVLGSGNSYELILEDCNKPLITAQKKALNRTSNYHFFDMTRGQVGGRLSKKNGNYIGKLRAKSISRTEYALVNSNSNEREELAGIVYDRTSFIEQLKDGCQPREMLVVVPPLDGDNVPIPYKTEDSTSSKEMNSLTDCLLDGSNVPRGYSCLKSKDPVFENGNYRLNFNGRVTLASVKNFQLVNPDDVDDIICQFGKIGEDDFHLDFKAPLNAIQAFALAITQFNL